MIVKFSRWAPSACLFICLLAAVGMQSAHAQVKEFNVPAQSATTGIPEFARQAGIQILVSEPLVRGKQVGAVSGTHNVSDGLALLLKGTGLIAESKDGLTYTLAVGPPASARKNLQSSLSENSQATTYSALSSKDNDASVEDPGRGIPEILVKGSKTQDVDIRRTQNDIQPYAVFDQKDIQQSGAADLREFFAQRLPMAVGIDNTAAGSPGQGNQTQVNLRGLGTNQTLVLVDGRRVAGSGYTGLQTQPDLNGIPLAAIERIEVLPTSASGIYGGGATGGVVNVILKRNYSGGDASITYQGTSDGGGSLRRIDATGGFTLSDGTSVMISGSYADTSALLLGERNFEQAYLARLQSANPTALITSDILGSTTNIRSSNGDLLSLIPALGGKPLNSTITSVPFNYAGVTSDNGAGLLANAGRYNLLQAATAQLNGGLERGVQNASLVKSIMANVRHSFDNGVEAFVDLTASDNSSSNPINGLSGTFDIPAGAPANPFSQDITVTTPTFGADQAFRSSIADTRAVAGIIVPLPRQWSLESDFTYDRTRVESSSPNSEASDSLATDITNGTVNVFRDTNQFPANFAPYTLTPTVANPEYTTLKSASLRASGPIGFRLPGGETTLTALVEHRVEALSAFSSSTESSDGSFSPFSEGERRQTVSSLYLEATLPVISPTNDVLGIDTLELQAAVRGDRYRITADGSTIAGESAGRFQNDLSSIDPTLGFKYKPTTDITLRGSYATGFLPPTGDQLIPGVPASAPGFIFSQIFGLTDPKRGNEAVGANNDIVIASGGNPRLNPEKSKTWSIGTILTPRITPNLRVSVDWTRINKTADIVTPDISQQFWIDLENSLPGFIVRGPPSGGFAVGPIIQINQSLINVARTRVDSYDFTFDYKVDTARYGRFELSALGSLLHQSTLQIAPGAVVSDFAGTEGKPSLGGNATLSWDYRDWTVAWTARYLSSYYLNQDRSFVANQGSATIPSQTYHDVFGSFRVSSRSRLLNDVDMRFGLRNVFNKAPPVDVNSVIFISPESNPMGRTYYFTVRKSF